jgi:DNA adenine methylase
MLKPGISQIGGNSRTRKVLLANTPYHEYFLSLFTGSGIYEFNKPKAHHYECLNEINPEFVNYFIVIKKFFKEFEERRKKGPYTIVSRYLYELLNAGVLTPNDMIEQAIQFYYKIKLSYASQLTFRGLIPETTSKIY